MQFTREQIKDFLIDEGFTVKEKSSRGELIFNSPFDSSDTKRRCGINYKKNGRWNCYLSGENSKNFIDFIKKIKGFESRFEAKIFFLKNYLLITDLKKYFETQSFEYSEEETERSKIELPEDQYIRLTESNQDSIELKKYFDYLHKRHIDNKLIFDLKIFADLYDQRVLFPFYENSGELTFYTARSILEGDFLPWKNLSGARNGLVYNIENIEAGSTVFIFEAIFDCLMVYPRGVATLGRKLDSVQMEAILARAPYKIVVVNDGDSYGQESQKETAARFAAVHDNVFIFDWQTFYFENQKFSDCKDFNKLGLIAGDIIHKYIKRWDNKTKLKLDFLRKIGR